MRTSSASFYFLLNISLSRHVIYTYPGEYAALSWNYFEDFPRNAVWFCCPTRLQCGYRFFNSAPMNSGIRISSPDFISLRGFFGNSPSIILPISGVWVHLVYMYTFFSTFPYFVASLPVFVLLCYYPVCLLLPLSQFHGPVAHILQQEFGTQPLSCY